MEDRVIQNELNRYLFEEQHPVKLKLSIPLLEGNC